MVVGDLPYKADTPMAVIFKHINAPLPIPRHKIPELPESVERVILKSLSKNPDDRYMTAGEMVRALQKAIDHPTVVQTLKSTSQREEDGTKAATKPVHVKPTKPRFLKWAVRILAIFLLGIGIGVYIDTILTNQRVTEFKSEAQTVAESISPSIASSILGYDPKRSDSPPRDLHDMMKAIGRGQKLFTYAILYMPDQSENHVLWRYQAKMWYDEYKDDNRKISPAGGFRKIFISTPLERAMQKAFNGDITALSSFNSNSKSSWQSVITGKIGKPIAILRLTIWGIGGDERMIK